MTQSALLTVDEVAQRLAVHPDTVRNWIKSGELPAIDLGGRAGYRITEDDLAKFLKNRRSGRKD